MKTYLKIVYLFLVALFLTCNVFERNAQAEVRKSSGKKHSSSSAVSGSKSTKLASTTKKPEISKPEEETKKTSKETLPKKETVGTTDGAEVKEKGTEPAKGGFGFNSGDGKSPIYITSDALNLDSRKRAFTYSGNVKIVQEEITITAEVVVGKYDDNNVIQEIVCTGKVFMTKGTDLVASANRALYKTARQTVELTEGPEVTHRGSTLNADKIIVYLKEDRSEAEGNVRVKVEKQNKSGFDLKDMSRVSGSK